MTTKDKCIIASIAESLEHMTDAEKENLLCFGQGLAIAAAKRAERDK